MTFPNTRDVAPNISRDDAINLLLASIALEEFGLANIINAESEKINHIVGLAKHTPSLIGEIKEISRSVGKTIQDIIKLQMLLQFKFDSLSGYIFKPSAPMSMPSTTIDSTPLFKNIIVKNSYSFDKKSSYSLTGCGKGYISKQSDHLYGGLAAVSSHICTGCGTTSRSSLTYTVKKTSDDDTTIQFMCAIPESIEIKCPVIIIPDPTRQNPNVLVICGEGVILKESLEQEFKEETGHFTLTVSDEGITSNVNFRMVIMSSSPSMNHDSGTVNVQFGSLKIGTCID